MPPKRKASRSPRRSSAAPAAPAQRPEERPVDVAEGRLQTSSLLTTAQGVRLPDTDHSLKAGPRGPSLMDDFHLREKITHFDHERIPERVVHARGAAAHGTSPIPG
jgi:catalase